MKLNYEEDNPALADAFKAANPALVNVGYSARDDCLRAIVNPRHRCGTYPCNGGMLGSRARPLAGIDAWLPAGAFTGFRDHETLLAMGKGWTPIVVVGITYAPRAVLQSFVEPLAERGVALRIGGKGWRGSKSVLYALVAFKHAYKVKMPT